MKKYLFLGFLFALFSSNTYAQCGSDLYQLSTGARVDYERTGEKGANGEVAEKWCKEKGMRLPTKEELREMYNKRHKICDYYNSNPKSCFNTEFEDAGGWPYWGQRVDLSTVDELTRQRSGCGATKSGEIYGWRIIFGRGSDTYVQFPDNKAVRKFGDQGEEQLVQYWISSGRGGYARCVCDGSYW